MPLQAIQAQHQAVQYLQRVVAQQRVPQALLFSGPEGVGKRTAALAWAQTLNCLAPQPNDACGECLSCKKIAAGIHPDVSLLVPEGQHMKIDQIREHLQRSAIFKPLEGRYKVYLLDPADALTLEAANSLLKLLEEPPPQVTLVLISSQPFLLLPTLQSRCQEVRFHPWPQRILQSWLQARLGCTSSEAHTWAMLSGGRPAEALRLADPEMQALRKRVFAMAGQRFTVSWVKLAEQLEELRAELPEALTFLLTWFRDLLLLVQGGDPELLINPDYQTQLQVEVGQETPEKVSEKCRAVLEALQQLKRNVNLQLVIEVLWIKLTVTPRSG